MMDQVVAVALFAVALLLIFNDWLHRTIVAIGGAVAMLVAGRLIGFYDEEDALASIDFDTIGLLLGMMIVVALLEPTGFFEYLALQAGRLSGGRPLRLFLLLGSVTTVLSMFLDNVTTVVVMAPVTLVIARVLGMHAAPLLMAEAMLSNIGGIATLVGDPPNILIGSAADLSFNDFLTHSLPVVVFTWAAAVATLWFLLRGSLVAGNENGGHGAADAERAQAEGTGSAAAAASDAEGAAALHPNEALRQPGVALRVIGVLGGAVALFFFQEMLHVSPAFVALAAAAAALVLVRPDVVETLHHVEWSVLLFFSALFVMIGGLEASGVLERLAQFLSGTKDLPPVLLGIMLIWVVAALSAVVDNIPITIALIPVIAGLEPAGIDPGPLWWALAFGAGLGGNATVIGSTANIVVVSVSERSDMPMGSRDWMRKGIPLTLVACVVTSAMYAVLFPLISR